MANVPDELRARFEDHKRNIDHELQKAKELRAEAEAIEAKLVEKKRRIDAAPVDTDACPDCTVERGETNIIVARRADDPSRFDRWGCPKCGYYFDVPSH